MSYIQLALLDIPAIILEMDTLTQEIKDSWRTIGYYRKYKEFNNEFKGIENI
jgi:hypothetical protein